MTYNVELVELTKASFKSRDPAAERSSDLIGPTQPAIADKQEEQVRDDLPKNVWDNIKLPTSELATSSQS